jgi:hypothetical protein
MFEKRQHQMNDEKLSEGKTGRSDYETIHEICETILEILCSRPGTDDYGSGGGGTPACLHGQYHQCGGGTT